MALSEAIIAEMETVLHAAREETIPLLLTLDLAALEQRVPQMSRCLWGHLIAVILAQRAQHAPRPARGAPLRRRERTRPLHGLVGDDPVPRPWYWCAGCGQSQAPRDEDVGLGPGVLSPGVARVVARAALEVPFEPTVPRRSPGERGAKSACMSRAPPRSWPPALTPATAEAAEAHPAALSYFTTHAARMDYPRFVAQHLPIGWGAGESSCTCRVQARAKGAGMRWSTAGGQHSASLRALHRSGRGGGLLAPPAGAQASAAGARCVSPGRSSVPGAGAQGSGPGRGAGGPTASSQTDRSAA